MDIDRERACVLCALGYRRRASRVQSLWKPRSALGLSLCIGQGRIAARRCEPSYRFTLRACSWGVSFKSVSVIASVGFVVSRRHKMSLTPITRFSVQIITGDRDKAGTDGDVYVGLCGREFYIDSADSSTDPIDDFERGSDRTYNFGSPHNVHLPDKNDPSSPYQIFLEDIDVVPAYIRFAPTDDDQTWNLEEVNVIVNNGAAQLQALGHLTPKDAPRPQDHLWLGREFGLYCYLWNVSSVGVARARAKRRESPRVKPAARKRPRGIANKK
jgi:PLAT/LH2 domain